MQQAAYRWGGNGEKTRARGQGGGKETCKKVRERRWCLKTKWERKRTGGGGRLDCYIRGSETRRGSSQGRDVSCWGTWAVLTHGQLSEKGRHNRGRQRALGGIMIYSRATATSGSALSPWKKKKKTLGMYSFSRMELFVPTDRLPFSPNAGSYSGRLFIERAQDARGSFFFFWNHAQRCCCTSVKLASSATPS